MTAVQKGKVNHWYTFVSRVDGRFTGCIMSIDPAGQAVVRLDSTFADVTVLLSEVGVYQDLKADGPLERRELGKRWVLAVAVVTGQIVGTIAPVGQQKVWAYVFDHNARIASASVVLPEKTLHAMMRKWKRLREAA